MTVRILGIAPGFIATRRLLAAVALACVAVSPSCWAAPAEDAIRVVTEELPPYNMTRNGHVTGLATEIVEAVLAQAGLRASIESMPWERCYESALTSDNTLIYSISRTPDREPLFKWVGAVSLDNHLFLFASPARRSAVTSLGAARAYRIATVNGDAPEQFLLSNGFTAQNFLRVPTSADGYSKLRSGAVDLWIETDVAAHYIARQQGDDPTRTMVAALDITGGDKSQPLMMAFGPHTPERLVQRLRTALAAIHANGTFDAIQQKWR